MKLSGVKVTCHSNVRRFARDALPHQIVSLVRVVGDFAQQNKQSNLTRDWILNSYNLLCHSKIEIVYPSSPWHTSKTEKLLAENGSTFDANLRS